MNKHPWMNIMEKNPSKEFESRLEQTNTPAVPSKFNCWSEGTFVMKVIPRGRAWPLSLWHLARHPIYWQVWFLGHQNHYTLTELVRLYKNPGIYQQNLDIQINEILCLESEYNLSFYSESQYSSSYISRTLLIYSHSLYTSKPHSIETKIDVKNLTRTITMILFFFTLNCLVLNRSLIHLFLSCPQPSEK